MNKEIICPHCSKAFAVDESSYAEILKQVKNKEYEEEIENRLQLAENEKKTEIELVKQQLLKDHQSVQSQSELKIQELEEKSKQSDLEKELAIKKALDELKDEHDRLLNEVNGLKKEKETALELERLKKDQEIQAISVEKANELTTAITKKDQEIQELKSTISQNGIQHQLAIREAVQEIEKERDEIRGDLKSAALEKEISEKSLQEKHLKELEMRDEYIERLKDMKAKLSVKLLGENLEQHCENEFNRNRALGFPNAFFEKDNDARTGSKGDYIFRDSDDSGVEFISIMFEMKNEHETSATKKKNEDFFKELDKDRKEKGCEYAILVSMLESDNELYNTGIVDVSHRYEKMYVIRPQFFIPMITLLRNAAMSSLSYKAQLAEMKAQNVDVTQFEDKLNAFKDAFSKNYETASKKFHTAIEEIDKSISHLQKTKDALLSSDRQLRLANDKATDVTIKKLTHNNKTMREAFKDASSGSTDPSEDT